jgi:hypothetical protein
MEETSANGFLNVWHTIMIIGAIIFLALSILQFIFHKVRLATIKEPKDKYDFIRQNEIENYKRVFIFLAISVACVINTYAMGNIDFHPVWFGVRIFMSLAGALLVGYTALLILQYYYPTQMHKKLKKLRYQPRINPENGHEMRLLGEHEEDVHLEEGMQAEENIFSVDYDVWVDESTGYTKIEKYPGHLEALQCNNCGFYTMKVVREEILEPPTADKDGELVKHYQCEYCKSIRATQFHIVRDSYKNYAAGQPNNDPNGTGIGFIRVEIITTSGERRVFEFQSREQAEKFLAEYENSSIA